MKGKFKNIFYILIFILSFTGIFASTAEPVWFATPSEYQGDNSGLENGKLYNDSWYGINFTKQAEDDGVVKSLTNMKGMSGSKFGDNFFAIPVTSTNKLENSWLAVKLNRTLESNQTYNIRFWYQNGWGEDRLDNGISAHITTEIYLVKELPVLQSSEGEKTDPAKYLADKIPVLSLKDTGDTNYFKNICSLNFTVDTNGEYYLLFVPSSDVSTEIPETPTVRNATERYFALEQANTNIISMSVEASDEGVKFVEGKYKDTYGKGDKNIGKNEKVKVTLKLSNSSLYNWNHENHIAIDVSKIGKVETGTDSFSKVKGQVKEILAIGDKYEREITNGETKLIFKGKELLNKDKADYYEYVFFVEYDYTKESNLEVKYDIYDFLENSNISTGENIKEEINSKNIEFFTQRDISREQLTIVKNHSILNVKKENTNNTSVLKEYLQGLNNTYINKLLNTLSTDEEDIVKLGDNIGRNNTGTDDGWIETLRTSKRTLYYGNNTLKIKVSHSGYVAGYLYKGTLTATGTNWSWEKVFEVPVTGVGEAGNSNGSEIEQELYKGINRITFTTPSDTDDMSKFILKYSINREDVKSLTEYGMSGEVEDYDIEPGKSFVANIIERKDLGVPQDIITTDTEYEGIIGKNDGKYSYRERVQYTVAIKNDQAVSLRNKRLTFKSNMAVVDVSSLTVNENPENGENYSYSAKIPRIEKKPNQEGMYEILINEIPAETTYNVRFEAELLREDFKADDNNWALKDELLDGVLDVTDKSLEEIKIESREYGNNYEGYLDKTTEVRHYNPFVDDKNGYLLYLGKNVNYDNQIHNIIQDSTNDGVYLQKYTGEKALYKDKYALFTGIKSPVYVGINKLNSWVSIWINNEEKWQEGTADRYFVFRNYDTSGYKYEGNPDNITDIENIGKYRYKLEIQPPDQPGVFKTLRIRTAYNQIEIDDPLETASSGEVEDYEVVILPPLEPVVKFTNLGVPINGENHWADDGENKKLPVRFGSKVKYEMEIKNLVNMTLEGKSIVFRTNMVSLDLNSFKKEDLVGEDADNSVNITIKEREVSLLGYKDYEIILDEIAPLKKTKIVVEGTVDREDTTEWELIDSFWSDGALWEEIRRGYLDRNYGSFNGDIINHREARHYKLQLNDDTVAKLGSNIPIFNNNASQLNNDGIEFPLIENQRVIYENGNTPLKLNVSHDGFISAWIRKDGSIEWEPILVSTGQDENNNVASVSKDKLNTIIVRTKGILDKNHVIRIRYSLLESDVLEATGPAITGEVEDYSVLGKEILKVQFTEDSHTDEGIVTDKGIVGVNDGQVSYKENVRYKIAVENLSDSDITDQEIVLRTNLGKILDLKDFEVVSNNNSDNVTKDNIEIVDISKIGNSYNEYLIKIKNMLAREILTIKPVINIDKEYIEVKSNEKYDFMLRDSIFVANVERATHELLIEDMDFEKSIIGYYVESEDTDVSTDIYDRFYKRARHNVVKLSKDSSEKIQLGETNTGDRNQDLRDGRLEGIKNIRTLQEKDEVLYESYGDGVGLRIKAENGSGNIEGSGIPANDLLLGPWKYNGPKNEGYILYNKAKNILPITVNHDGYVGIWIRYNNYTSGEGYDYSKHTYKWDDGNSIFYGPFEVKAGVNNIEVDLSNREGWHYDHYPASYSYHSTDQDFWITKTANIRVRYGLTEEEVETPVGVATSGEVEDYKINSFISPFKVEFGKINDLGIIKDENAEEKERIGGEDGLLTYEEDFIRSIFVTNVTRATQTNKKIILRTSMSSITNLDSFKSGNITIKKIGNDQYIDRYYPGVYFTEYEITIASIQANEKLEIPLEMKIDKTGDSYRYNYTGETYSWHFLQYVQYEKRTIKESDYGRLFHDRGYQGYYNDTLKHFQFQIDGNNVSLGSGITYEPSDLYDGGGKNESETGNALTDEGVKNFPKYQARGETSAKNTLFGSADHIFNIEVSHDGYVGIYTNIGTSSAENWVLLLEPQEVKANQINNLKFKFLPDLEGEEDKILRVRYGIRKKDALGNGDNPLLIASTGEVEDYKYRVMPPITAKFLKWEDLGVETDITNSDGTNFWGKNDGNWGWKSIIKQHIQVENLTDSNFSSQDLESKLIKFQTNLGTIIAGQEDFALEIEKNVDGQIVTEKITENISDYFEIVSQKDVGTEKAYYFQLKKLESKTKYNISFNFKIERENYYLNLENELWIVRDYEEEGILQEKTSDPEIIGTKFPNAKIDGGFGGWHYFTKERPHLSKNKNGITYEDDFFYGSHYSRTNEYTSADNDGVDVYTYSDYVGATPIYTLISNVKNEITIYPTHKGFVRVWLGDNWVSDPSDEIPLTDIIEITDEDLTSAGKKITFYVPDKHPKTNTSLHSNAANRYLKVKYTLIKEELEGDKSSNYIGNGTGAATGESEDYHVRVLPPLDLKFIDYTELGVNGSELPNERDKYTYGLGITKEGDGNVGFGERVRETFRVTNISEVTFKNDNPAPNNFDNKLIELNMKNAILELASDGKTVDLTKLGLEVIMLDTKTRAVRDITSEATVEYIEHGKYHFKLKEISSHSEIDITYNFLVDSDTDASNVVNSIGIYNNSNIERDNTDDVKINKVQEANSKYPYPYMKRDYNAEGSSDTYGLGRHHYVNEMPHLGNLVGYETTGNSLENDGLIIKTIQRFGESTATLTLFSEEWNELILPKISHDGYIRIWINNELVPIQQNENDTVGTITPLSVNASTEPTTIKIKPPKKFEYQWGNQKHYLTIRYSVYAGDLTDNVNGPSRIGETEQYQVRVIPPLDGRFVHVAESSNEDKNLRRDLGVKLNSTRADGVEEILGNKDGNYTLRELYEEQIFIKNLNSEDTQPKTLTFKSNISVPYIDHDILGIEVKLYAKEIVAGETAYDIVKEQYEIQGIDAPIATYQDKNITISNLKLKANQQGVLVFKLKVTEEDTDIWKIKNEFTISGTFQDTTYEEERVYDDREHPLILVKNHSLNKEGYYPQFKRDYENDSAPYSWSYNYYHASGGVRSYLINRESTIPDVVDLILNNNEGKSLKQKYASLGEKIYPENVYVSYGHEIPWANGSVKARAEDDDSLIGSGAKDDRRNLGDIHQKDGKFILYNNANNLFPIEVTKNGYVTISLWTRAGHNLDGGSWADEGNAEFLTTEPVFVKAGEENNIVVPINNKWFADYWPYYDEDLQDDKSRYGVLRVKYALEKDDPGLNSIDGRTLYTGEIEDYQIAGFEPALAIDNVEITDMGLNDPRDTSITIENYNAGDGVLSYGEYYYYTLTIHNPSTATQTKSFIHVNGRGNLNNNKDLKEEGLNNIQKYREIYPKIEIIDQKECPDTTVEIESYTEPEFSGDDGRDAKITVYNLPPGKTIKVKYLARIIAEHEIGYNEDLESGWNHMYKNTEVYKWYGKDEFWLDRRKLILNPRNLSEYTSNLQNLLENGSKTNILLKGQGSDGNGNDILTARDYGNGYIGYKAADGTIIGQTSLTETRHYKATDATPDRNVMKIGSEIKFENSIKDISGTDGLEFLHKQEGEDLIIYGGIQNGVIVNVTHDGYISFFLNNGEDYVHGISNSDYWKNEDILLAAVDTRTETTQTPLPDEAFSSTPIKVEGNKEGGNKIAIKVPDYPESTRVLRIRYAAHAEDITTPIGAARSGEVQDIVVKVIPLGTGFIDNIDKGVITEGNKASEQRLGYNDKKYHYKEVYENHFRVHNESPYIKTPAKILLFSPTSRVVDTSELLEGEKLHRIESIIGGEDSTENPLKIESVTSTWNEQKKGYDNIITINRLLAGEQVDVWIHLFKEKEDIETWRASHQLWVGYLEEDGKENIILEDEEFLPITERDYGSGYLNPDMIANDTIEAAKTEVRHYSLVEENGSSENIRLGINYNIEDYPRDQKEDGVSLPSNLMGELVLYNNLINEIQVFPTTEGYITSWINQGENWDSNSTNDKILVDSVIKKVQEEGIEQEVEKGNSVEDNVASVNEEYNIIKIKVPDYLEKSNSDNPNINSYIEEIAKIFRVRYALDKDDITDNESPARSGEVEDYQIKIVSGLKATFQVITDLGVTINNDVNLDGTSGNNKKLHIGKQDGNLIPGEVYLHKIKVENLSGVDQENINLVYKTVVGNVVNYDDYSELTSENIKNNIKVKILNQDGEYIDSDEYSIVEVSKVENSNEIEYKITVNKIKKDEDIFIFFHSKVMKEDEILWKLVDKVFIDGILNDQEEYPMVRDYGSGWVEGNNSLEEEARHYITKLKLSDTQDLTPIALGEKVTQDEEIVVDAEDGVKFKKDLDYGDAIIYDNLRNKLEVTAAFPGYISFWLNSAPLNNNTSEWDITNVVPSRREEQDVSVPYRDINTIKGRNDYPTEILVDSSKTQISKALAGKDYDIFYVKIPSYIQKNTTGNYEDHSQKILRFRYSIAKSDIETNAKGLDNPIGTALTGEVEDYRVRLVNGFQVKLLGLIDRGIMPDKDNDLTVSNSVSDEFDRIKSVAEENASRLERVGARDGNVSPRELVDTVLEVKNVTGVYQTGFVEEEKNRMLIKINNGELDTNNNFIWIRSIIEEEGKNKIVTEFQNIDDDNWVNDPDKGDSIPNENHRVRVIKIDDESIKSQYGLTKNEKLYEIKIDYIKADETLQIYLRQFVTDEFTTSDEDTGSNYAIRNELIFEQVDNKGNSTVKKEDSIKSLPMKRDYGTLLEGISENSRTRHYSTNINKEPNLEEGKENKNEDIGNSIQVQEMKLGDEYSVEEDPKVNPKDDDNGIEFITKSDENNNKENILYYGFWNEVEVTLNHKGYFSVWLSKDGEDWTDSLSLAVSKDELYEPDGKIKADTNIKQVELTPDENGKAKLYINLPENLYLNQNKKLRVRYALNRSDVENPRGAASSGEVEDYEVRIVAGLELDIFDYIDIGREVSNINNQNDKLIVGYQDRYVTVEEDIIRRINIDNVAGVEQRDLDFNYYTDIGQVDTNFFEIIRDNRIISNNITMNDNIKLTIEEDTSYSGTGKKYKLSLSKLPARKENLETGIVTTDRVKDITEIRIKENMIAESIPKDSDSFIIKRIKWHMNDAITYGEVEQATTRKLSTVDPITGVVKSIGSVPMVRDYGNGLLNGNIENDENDARHYLVTIGNPKDSSSNNKIEVRLGNNLTFEEIPQNNEDIKLDNGLEFKQKNDEIYIMSDLKNLVPLNISHSGYVSVWLSNNRSTEQSVDNDTQYSIPLIEQLKVSLENLEENNKEYIEVIGGKPYLILDIPSLSDYIANFDQAKNTNDGYKYIRIRYALEEKDVESPTGSAKTGEVEDYKVLVKGGLEVQFEKDKDATEYIPKDLGFYEGNWNTENWSLKNNASLIEKGGFGDGYIGYQEYIKHRIKIKNPESYPQENKSFIFTTSLGKLVKLTGEDVLSLDNQDNLVKIVSGGVSTIGITEVAYESKSLPSVDSNEFRMMRQYEISIDGLEANEEIVIEFVEKVASEDIVRGNNSWVLINKIFVDRENPEKYQNENSKYIRIFKNEFQKDYGSAHTINNVAANSVSAPRHYLGKINGEDEFVQLINLETTGIQTIINSEDIPKDDTTENNGVTFEVVENGKAILKNNFINEIKVRASHNGFIRVQMTASKGTTLDWDATTHDVLRKKETVNDKEEYLEAKILPINGGKNSEGKQYENTIYIQVPYAPNTEQLFRIRYALDEEDLENDIISKIGEIEEYIVKIGASVDISFVDSEHKEDLAKQKRDKAIEEVIFKKSENKLIKDLGIGVDRGGIDITSLDRKNLLINKLRAGYHDGQLSVGEDFMEIIRIENLTNIDQTTETDIELRNNIEYVFVEKYATDGNFELFINKDLAASEELFNKEQDFSEYVMIADDSIIKDYLDIQPLTSVPINNDSHNYKHRYKITLKKIQLFI